MQLLSASFRYILPLPLLFNHLSIDSPERVQSLNFPGMPMKLIFMQNLGPCVHSLKTLYVRKVQGTEAECNANAWGTWLLWKRSKRLSFQNSKLLQNQDWQGRTCESQNYPEFNALKFFLLTNLGWLIQEAEWVASRLGSCRRLSGMGQTSAMENYWKPCLRQLRPPVGPPKILLGKDFLESCLMVQWILLECLVKHLVCAQIMPSISIVLLWSRMLFFYRE